MLQNAYMIVKPLMVNNLNGVTKDRVCTKEIHLDFVTVEDYWINVVFYLTMSWCVLRLVMFGGVLGLCISTVRHGPSMTSFAKVIFFVFRIYLI